MTLVLLLLGRLAIYAISCAWNPFTDHSGRRRAPFWLRSWWRGEQAQNRDNSWTLTRRRASLRAP